MVASIRKANDLTVGVLWIGERGFSFSLSNKFDLDLDFEIEFECDVLV